MVTDLCWVCGEALMLSGLSRAAVHVFLVQRYNSFFARGAIRRDMERYGAIRRNKAHSAAKFLQLLQLLQLLHLGYVAKLYKNIITYGYIFLYYISGKMKRRRFAKCNNCKLCKKQCALARHILLCMPFRVKS